MGVKWNEGGLRDLGWKIQDLLYFTYRAEEANLALDDQASEHLSSLNLTLPGPQSTSLPYISGPKSDHVYLFNVVLSPTGGEYPASEKEYDSGLRAIVHRKQLFPQKQLAVVHLTNMNVPQWLQSYLASRGSQVVHLPVTPKGLSSKDVLTRKQDGLGLLVDYLSVVFEECYGAEHPVAARIKKKGIPRF